MPKSSKARPKFKTEAEEREFWESQDSSDQVDWSQARQVRVNAAQRRRGPIQMPGLADRSMAFGLSAIVF